MKKKFFAAALALLAPIVVFIFVPAFSKLDLNRLSKEEQKQIDSILAKTEAKLTLLKSQGKNPNWFELYDLKSGLAWKERLLIGKILRLKPGDLGARTPAQPLETVKVAYKEIRDQPITRDGKSLLFNPPLVSVPTFEKYEAMMQAMEKDLGRRLYMESGHRSRGYHLYNFLKYLREHDYSLLETGKLNALPGYSEHNLLVYHAIDLINQDGINGDPDAEVYEALPEHQWMLQHAGEFGFTLSYPRGNPFGIDFEPWHWRQTATTDYRPTTTA